MRKLLNLMITSMVLSSASFAQDRTASPDPQPKQRKEKVYLAKIAPYELLSPCLEYTELREKGNINQVDDGSLEGKVILTRQGYKYHTLMGAKPQYTQTDLYDEKVVRSIGNALTNFSENLNKKLKTIEAYSKSGLNIDKAHQDLITGVRIGLCSCERAGFDPKQIQAAKQTTIDNQRLLNQKVTSKDLECKELARDVFH